MRSRAGLRAFRQPGQADCGHCLVCNGAVQRSDGQAKADTDLIHPVTREYATDAADGLPMLWTCHTAAKALHRLCASSPGELGFPGASALGSECGFRWASQSSMQSADISELAEDVLCPFRADAHRRGTVPVLCPLRECSRIVTAWQRHGDPAALDDSLLRRQQGKREPTGICDCSAARSQIPYYNRAALGFPETDPVGSMSEWVPVCCRLGLRCITEQPDPD